MVDLSGKTALVTGGAKGIGVGIVLELVRCGANVIINYHSSSDGVWLAGQVQEMGGRAIAVQADVTDRGQVKRMVEAGNEAFGKIDILINNAAYQCNIPFKEYTQSHLDKIFTTNLYGYLLCMQMVIPQMKARKYGKIVNIGSVHAKRPTNFDPGYCMTKGSIKMLTREAAIELIPYGINVNAVEFGFVEIGIKSGNPQNPIPAGAEREPRLFRFAKRNIAGTIPYPGDAAPTVAYLVSDEAVMVNGAAVRVDFGNILV